MSTITTAKRCLIVGGGMAGLMAGTALQARGIRVIILDKGRGIGGRLATRRVTNQSGDEAIFDYGAQYFTARDERFRHYVERWYQQGLVEIWSRGFRTDDGDLKEDGQPRYVCSSGIRALAKELARELEVHRQTRVTGIELKQRRWQLATEEGGRFSGDALVLTPPVPQSLQLLDAAGIPLPDAVRARLEALRYHRCLAVLALLKKPSAIPPPGGVWLSGEPLRWLADNRQKGVSPTVSAVTLHAGPEYSHSRWEAEDRQIAAELFAAASPWLGGEVTRYQIHRWRFSQPRNSYRKRWEKVDLAAPLLFSGDAFSGGRVEGAALSGLEAAASLADLW